MMSDQEEARRLLLKWRKELDETLARIVNQVRSAVPTGAVCPLCTMVNGMSYAAMAMRLCLECGVIFVEKDNLETIRRGMDR